MKNEKNVIVGQASFFFSSHGVKSISMDEIAMHCGISKRTLYQLFESKEALVMEVVRDLVARNEQHIRFCRDISPDAITEISNFFKYIDGMLEVLTPMFSREIKKYFPDAYDMLMGFREGTLLPYLRRNFDRGIAENLYRGDFDKDMYGKTYCWQIQHVQEDGFLPVGDIHCLIQYFNGSLLRSIVHPSRLKLLPYESR